MTETGLGGGVECEALNGYHLREADLFFEVVDHETGEICPDGVVGEVIFTTLTREGMPLIRYRTGDMASFITDSCPCGSVLRRMDKIKGRWDGAIALGPVSTLTLPDMDESLFRLAGLMDYRATVSKGSNGKFQLHITVHRAEGCGLTGREIVECLNQIESIQKSIADGSLETPVVVFSAGRRWTTTGVAKRKIVSGPIGST
jgi:phenylacetate-coenzyme A ligase PaaK-like adenylate-forming protein